ncbi:MAG: hypothetical protein H8D26_00910 [Methanomicrobia archaeon]|nr:hypothetical protein [Methanomicrobia archaeon]
MIEKDFLNELKKIALNLNEGKTGTLSELRRLERKLYLIEIYKEWNTNEVKFLAYFIKQIVGIIWRNFAVDTPIELNDAQLERLSKTIGSFLTEALNLLEKDEIDKAYKAFSSVINELYLSIIEANEILYRKE